MQPRFFAIASNYITNYLSNPIIASLTPLEALSHPFASMMRFMDAYLLLATVGCAFARKSFFRSARLLSKPVQILFAALYNRESYYLRNRIAVKLFYALLKTIKEAFLCLNDH